MESPLFDSARKAVRLEDLVNAVSPLRAQGTTFIGRCPFHHDKGRPNLAVFPTTQTYFCFACGARGDAIDFLARLHHTGQAVAAHEILQTAATMPKNTARAKAAIPVARAPKDRIDWVYRALLGMLSLFEEHLEGLKARGLSREAIWANAYRSLPDGAARQAVVRELAFAAGEGQLSGVPGFYFIGEWRLAGVPGLLIPVRTADGMIAGIQIRSQISGQRSYTWLSSARRESGISPGAPIHVAGRLPSPRQVWLTEGPLKADFVADRLHTVCLATPGVALWRHALPVLSALNSAEVVLAFDRDSDPATRAAVMRHVSQAARVLRKDRQVRYATWRHGKGIDDALALGEEISVFRS